jgi:L-lactate utilization protein LutB
MSTDTHDKDAEIQALRAENRCLRAIIQGNKEALRKATAELVEQSKEIAHLRDEIQMRREMVAETMHELINAQRQAPASSME